MSRPLAVLALLAPACLAAPNAAAEEVIDVRVEGTPVDERSDPTPASYVLDDEALERPGVSLAEALGRVPGVELRRSGGATDPASVSIRAASGAQTPVLLAGVELNDELTGGADLSRVPTWMLHRAEVYRGHAPAHALDFGIGGAIVLEPRLPRGTEGRVGMEAGSFGQRALLGAASLGDEDAAALLALRAARGDGDYAFVDDRGTRFDPSDDVTRRRANADYRELDAWSVARARVGRARLSSVLNVLAREQGAPGLRARGAVATRAELSRTLAGLRSITPCGAGGCALELAAHASLLRYRLTDPGGELGLAGETRSRSEDAAQRIRVSAAPSPWLRVAGGTSQRVAWLDVEAGGLQVQHARRHVLRGELDVRFLVGPRVTLIGVGALECHSTASLVDADTCGVLAPVGRLGALWRAHPALAVRANVGRYVRVPTLGELHGISSVVRGNPSLDVERGVSVDAGATVRHGGEALAGWGQLFGFARFADGLIAFRRSSLGTVTPYNAMSARVLGAELAGRLGVMRFAFAGLALSLVDARDTSAERQVENDRIPLQPSLVVASDLELRSPAWPAIGLYRASLAARYRYRSSRAADPAGLMVLRSDGQLDLEATLAFARRATLRVRLANLLDVPAFDVVGFPLPGRALYATTEVQL